MYTDEKNDFQRTVLWRRIFNNHGLKYQEHQKVWRLLPEFAPPILAILTSGIFSGEALKGPKCKYPVAVGDLLVKLAFVALDYDISVNGDDDTLIHLDIYFEWLIGIIRIAQLGLILEKRIKKLWQACHEKLSARILEGKAPPSWTYIQLAAKAPPPKAHRLVDIFLDFVPIEAPATYLATWTNSVLRCVGEEPVPDRTLRGYIAQEKQKRKEAPSANIS